DRRDDEGVRRSGVAAGRQGAGARPGDRRARAVRQRSLYADQRGDRPIAVRRPIAARRRKGRTLMAEVTFLEAIREALFEEMARDERMFVLGEDVGAIGGAFRATEGLLATFGDTRVVDTPISESAIIGASIGAAYMGLRPVAELQFIDF